MYRFSCSGTSCFKEAEDADLEEDGRRAVAGRAEVCDHTVHVEHLEVDSRKNFQPIWSRRLGVVAADVIQLWLTEESTFAILVEFRGELSDRNENDRRAAVPRCRLPKKF